MCSWWPVCTDDSTYVYLWGSMVWAGWHYSKLSWCEKFKKTSQSLYHQNCWNCFINDYLLLCSYKDLIHKCGNVVKWSPVKERHGNAIYLKKRPDTGSRSYIKIWIDNVRQRQGCDPLLWGHWQISF